jgi:hypothetical protein
MWRMRDCKLAEYDFKGNGTNPWEEPGPKETADRRGELICTSSIYWHGLYLRCGRVCLPLLPDR